MNIFQKILSKWLKIQLLNCMIRVQFSKKLPIFISRGYNILQLVREKKSPCLALILRGKVCIFSLLGMMLAFF